MATNHDHRDENKKSDEPDFSKDNTLEFHNKQNLKDLNSEAYSSKDDDLANVKTSKNDNEEAEPEEYRSHSVSKTSVRDRIPHTNTDISPEQ